MKGTVIFSQEQRIETLNKNKIYANNYMAENCEDNI